MIRKLFNYADVSDLGWTPFQSSTNLFKKSLQTIHKNSIIFSDMSKLQIIDRFSNNHQIRNFKLVQLLNLINII